ncbi:MAG: hypothetical protein RO469_17475 [Thermincola sp.]|nr:hypothetical protein [Thermincola sp.]MDT3703129.1 hypothetical protein [Thermincola sp.]
MKIVEPLFCLASTIFQKILRIIFQQKTHFHIHEAVEHCHHHTPDIHHWHDH